jgi:hypothetical protein
MPLDLAAILPQLLPSAITWAESQARLAQELGEPLNAAGVALATKVGVARPGLVRTRLVDHLPVPDNPLLREAALQVGLLGPGAVGLTLGYSIFIVTGNMNPRLLAHECRHVCQYEGCGSIAKFLPVYLGQIITVGYDDAPLEQDARAHEVFGVN